VNPRALTITVLAMALGACRGEPSAESPIVLLRNMHYQQRYNSQAESAFFSDKRTMRAPPEGTVSRFPGGANAHYVDFTVSRDNGFDDDRVVYGHEPDSPVYVASVPASVVADLGGGQRLLQRGQQRFGIYCALCHGRAADGRGQVWLRSIGGGTPNSYNYIAPTNLHDERLKHVPDGQIFATISNGIRNMPAYSGQIPVRDRWAIVAYVRALQVAGVGGAR
jgi:mono/diheme cytochrome c family protein